MLLRQEAALYRISSKLLHAERAPHDIAHSQNMLRQIGRKHFEQSTTNLFAALLHALFSPTQEAPPLDPQDATLEFFRCYRLRLRQARRRRCGREGHVELEAARCKACGAGYQTFAKGEHRVLRS